jgi:hypothetical protein
VANSAALVGLILGSFEHLLERQKHQLHSDSGEASCEKQVP